MASSSTSTEENNSGRPACQYGAECYRSNEQHKANFWHPKRGKRKSEIQQESDDLDEELANVVKKRKSDASNDEQLSSEDAESETEVTEEDDGSEGHASGDHTQPATPPGLSPREEIKLRFKMEMPEDFYDFWEFCQSLGDNPTEVLKASMGLELVGPYDVLAGKLKRSSSKSKRSSYCLHWRYYYDPPEFQTVIRGDDEAQHHLGYYRDEPDKLPVFVGANSAKKSCSISAQGDNIFAAVKLHMDKLCKTTRDQTEKNAFQSLLKPLTDWAKKCSHSLDPKTPSMKARDKAVVTKTFHGAGIVVPVDANGVGYRELPETDASLKRIFKKIVDSKSESERNRNLEPLDEILSFIQFANDECDYGEGYELGVDLFLYGSPDLHGMVKNTLPLAYTLLDREGFREILEAHLEDRRMDNLSMI